MMMISLFSYFTSKRFSQNKRWWCQFDFFPKGLMDSSSRSAYFNCWNIHLHDWPTFHNDTSQRDRRVDTANQICSKTRCRSVRLPDFHSTHQKLFGEAESCRWVLNATTKISHGNAISLHAWQMMTNFSFLDVNCINSFRAKLSLCEKLKILFGIFKAFNFIQENVIKSSFHSCASTKKP